MLSFSTIDSEIGGGEIHIADANRYPALDQSSSRVYALSRGSW